jgi:hypothetical protein
MAQGGLIAGFLAPHPPGYGSDGAVIELTL